MITAAFALAVSGITAPAERSANATESLWVLSVARTHADEGAAGTWALGRMPARSGVLHDLGQYSVQEVQRAVRVNGDDVDAFTRGYEVEQWRGLVSGYSWPVEEALAVMDCESRGQPSATGGANYGLFQINAVHAGRVAGDLQALYDPATNIRVAYEIWSDQGWAPWACKPW